jgi:predicted metal-dependent HD superfamily phosphohydrolase
MNWHRFQSMCSQCRLSGDAEDLQVIYNDLCERYAEPHRAYHTIDHIAHCLNEFDLVRGQIPDAGAVEMALCFHDVVYVPGAADNELESAKVFRTAFSDRAEEHFIAKVSSLILITERGAAPVDLNGEFVCDIDKSSFGIAWPLFYRDSVNVRMEQRTVTDRVYLAGHVQFLNSLLEHDVIFRTKFFQRRYEDSARQNIKQLIAQINSLGGFAADASIRP